jgi:hypothetical protein
MAAMAIALGAKLMAGAGAVASGAAAAGGAVSSGIGGIMAAAKGMIGLGGAAGAAGSATAGAGLLGKLQMGASALSAFSSFAGGMAEKRQAEEQALEARFAANQAILQGRQQSNEILDGVVDRMAKTRVAYATAGLDGFSATPSRAISRIGQDGEADIQIANSDALMSYFSGRRSMRALKKRGAASGIMGVVQAGASLAKGYVDWKSR